MIVKNKEKIIKVISSLLEDFTRQGFANPVFLSYENEIINVTYFDYEDEDEKYLHSTILHKSVDSKEEAERLLKRCEEKLDNGEDFVSLF